MTHLTIGSEQNTFKAIRPVDQPFEPKFSGTFVKSNGTTNFGAIAAGMVLGRITASGKLRPVGKALVTSANSSSTSLAVGTAAAAQFRVGDSVTVTRNSTGVLGTATLVVSGSSDQIVVTEKTAQGLAHTVQLVDPSANDQSLYTTVTVNPTTGVATIKVYHSTGGGGAITSTVAQVLAQLQTEDVAQFISAAAGDTYTGSNTAIALASTPLAGGLAASATVTSSNAVTAIASGVLTLTSAITSKVGDIVTLADGSQTAIGILDQAINTLDIRATAATGTETHRDQDVSYSCSGFYTEAQLIGWNANTMADLGGIDLGDMVRL